MLRDQEAGIDDLFVRVGGHPFNVVYEPTVRAVLGHLGIEALPDLTLPEPRIARLADAETEEWVERYHRIARERVEGTDGASAAGP